MPTETWLLNSMIVEMNLSDASESLKEAQESVAYWKRRIETLNRQKAALQVSQDTPIFDEVYGG